MHRVQEVCPPLLRQKRARVWRESLFYVSYQLAIATNSLTTEGDMIWDAQLVLVLFVVAHPPSALPSFCFTHEPGSPSHTLRGLIKLRTNRKSVRFVGRAGGSAEGG
jgi:hypothetical protein